MKSKQTPIKRKAKRDDGDLSFSKYGKKKPEIAPLQRPKRMATTKTGQPGEAAE